jgi:nitrate reductase gamma subunit
VGGEEVPVMTTLLWVALPYLALGSFVLGHVWRWRRDQFGLRRFGSPMVPGRVLRLGSPLLHLGVIAVFLGHVLGLLIPRGWTTALGIGDEAYHLISVTAGTIAGAVMLAGLALLVARRVMRPTLRRATTVMDVVMYALLLMVVLVGVWATVGVNIVGAGHDYRETVAAWFRGVLVLRPDASLMAGAPLLMQVHTLAALALVASWPFTRLVHAWAGIIGVVWQPRVDRPLAG